MIQEYRLSDNEIKDLATLIIPAVAKHIEQLLESNNSSNEGYLKFNDACRYLGGISRNTLSLAIEMGQITSYPIAGNTILFKKSELNNLKQKVTSA